MILAITRHHLDQKFSRRHVEDIALAVRCVEVSRLSRVLLDLLGRV
jgi:hypothetical protein